MYVDSSVLLRVVLGEPDRLQSWDLIDQAVSSEVIRLECLRTVDRARIQLRLADDAAAAQRASILEAIDAIGMIPVSTPVLERAADPFPTVIGSLDAIHLASALLVREHLGDLRLATHDQQLALAARAMGFIVDGVASS